MTKHQDKILIQVFRDDDFRDAITTFIKELKILGCGDLSPSAQKNAVDNVYELVLKQGRSEAFNRILNEFKHITNSPSEAEQS